MAYTVVTETLLPRDEGVDVEFSVAYESAVLYNPATPVGSILAASGKSGTLILHFKNEDLAPQTVTILAGVGGHLGQAWRAGLGDLELTLAAETGEQMVFLTDTARFKQADGTIHLDISDVQVSLAAFRLAGH